MSGHTSGPWEVNTYVNQLEYDGCKFKAISVTNSGTVICDIDIETQCPEEEARANAQLIAAAPELFEAVKALLHAMEMQEGRETEQLHITSEVAWHIWSEAKDKATAAIARAEGKAE